MQKFFLVRHGQTQWNSERRVMGNLPVPLNDTGLRQAGAAAAALKLYPLQAIYSSPLQRAMETAEIIAAPHRLTPQPSQPLIELAFGDWQGKYWYELQDLPVYKRYQAHPTAVALPGGETVADVQGRAVNEIERLRSIHDQQNVAVVSHADVIKVILCYYLGMDLDLLRRLLIDNASISILTWEGNDVQAALVNGLGAAPPGVARK